MSNTQPIGVFDSGVGGLSVLREIRRELPAEDLIYVADSGYAPYGDRPEDYVRGRALAIMEFLRAQDVKAVVVACNTATGIAVDALRARYTQPIVAIEPAVKPAAAQTRSLVEQYLRPLLDKGADAIVLGCTHYPFVSDLIREVAGPSVSIIDSAGPVAREVRRRLQVSGLLAPESRIGTETFWTTGSPEQVAAVIEQLWSSKVDVRPMPVASEERSASTR